VDRGFVLSDHADWPGLQRAIAASRAQRVIVTHGYEAVMVRWLQQQGLQAGAFRTDYAGEGGGEGDKAQPLEQAPSLDDGTDGSAGGPEVPDA
jgi:putative mRNA 3-end processing factor